MHYTLYVVLEKSQTFLKLFCPTRYFLQIQVRSKVLYLTETSFIFTIQDFTTHNMRHQTVFDVTTMSIATKKKTKSQDKESNVMDA